jgi:hypothetical protein
MVSLLLSLFLSFIPFIACQSPDFSLSLSLPLTSAKQNFDVFGATTLHSDTIVLTPPGRPHLGGAIWSRKANTHQYWEVEFTFRVMGAERGGNGLAFWFTAKKGLGGPVFGNADQWDGLGLFFDGNTGGKVRTPLIFVGRW